MARIVPLLPLVVVALYLLGGVAVMVALDAPRRLDFALACAAVVVASLLYRIAGRSRP